MMCVWFVHMTYLQTKDPVVGEAMRNLKAHGLTVENIRKTPAAKLNKTVMECAAGNKLCLMSEMKIAAGP